MSRCIYSLEEFDDAAGEHILQNFLGARWTSKRISCDSVQELFGRTIDVALEKGLREIRNLLGTRGGRGESGPILRNLVGSSGNKYHIQPGGIPQIARPILSAPTVAGDAFNVDIALGDERQLGWAQAQLRDRYPSYSIGPVDSANMVVKETYCSERFGLRSGLGGEDFFRGALKAAFNLLGEEMTEVALSPAFDGVRKFVLQGGGNASDYIRWATTAESFQVPHIGEFDQFVGVYSKGCYVDGIVQFFGGIPFLMRLSDSFSGEAFQRAYLVDPTREGSPAEIRNPQFDAHALPAFDSGAKLPDEASLGAYQVRFEALLSRHYARADRLHIKALVEQTLSPYEGSVPPEEAVRELQKKLRAFFFHKLGIPQPPND